MNYAEILTRYIANFVDALAKNGLKNVVISPGSRSTPLAMTMCEHEEIKEWIIVDERSAAYFALGMAKQTKCPVALICTSGTAAANYFPAIIEAYYNRVPLIILTADRPHELRDVGASQAIDQIKMYGDYVKWFQEMPLPEASNQMLAFVRTKANQAFYIAREGNPGPIHLNFPFREPLIPDFEIENLWGNKNKESKHHSYEGIKKITQNEVVNLMSKVASKQKGLIVCGPQEDREVASAIATLAYEWGLPILADPLSQLRSGDHYKDYIIENYDAMFRNQKIREQLRPDFVIRFGAMPVSKYYALFIEEHQESLQFVVEPTEGFRNPTHNSTNFIYADPVLLCHDLIQTISKKAINKHWLHHWLHMNDIVKNYIQKLDSERITEGEAVRSLLEVIPNKSTIYVGNSMAVRDLDTFFMMTDKHITVLANRGVSGIEGLISSALGVVSTTDEHVTLIIGDLSFYHDLNGLLTAKQYRLNITILLINNNGGGIFSFLPQSKDKKYFELLFGTPINIDFQNVVQMYAGKHEVPQNVDELKSKLVASYQRKGLTVIEVKTERDENLKWHQGIWKEIEHELLIGE